MLTNTQIRILVGLALITTVVVSLVSGQPIPAHLATSFSYAVTGISMCLLLWNRWIWAWPVFRLWVKRPDLRGTWRGQLLSSWESVEGHRAGPIEAYVVIRQTFISLDVRLFTLESDSASLAATIAPDSAGMQTLYIAYRNEPKALIRDRSPIHYGGMLLRVRGTPAKKLDGTYWTDRATKGDIEFLEHVPEAGYDFNSAASSFVRSNKPTRRRA